MAFGINLAKNLATTLGVNLDGGGVVPALDWPLEMAALYPGTAWWDPRDASSIIAPSGNVNSWTDRISGNVVVQAGGGLWPIFSATAINGKPGMIGATGRHLRGAAAFAALLSGPSGTVPCTVLAYVRTPSTTPATTFACAVTGGITPSSGVLYEMISINTGALRLFHGAVSQGAVLPLAASTNYALATSYGSGQVRLYVNGVPDVGNPFVNGGAAASLNDIIIGARLSSGTVGNPWNGNWGDIIVIPADVAPVDVIDGCAWLIGRYA